MTRGTSLDELYETIGEVVETLTARTWWIKERMKSSPAGPYALVQITEGVASENMVVEEAALNGVTGDIRQIPWGNTLLDIRVEFFRDTLNQSALDSAIRFRNGLWLEERFFDLWQLAGLVGGIRLINVSALFRRDTEPRAECRFSIYANISNPSPLNDTDITEIKTQSVLVVNKKIDGEETEIPVIIQSPADESS